MAPFSVGKKKILRSTLERLAAAEVRIGQVYYDFKPANLIYQNNDCFFLVDPPDIWWRGVHLWDFACFRSSMRRHLWRISLRRPYDRHRRTIIRQSLVAFEQGYLTSFTNRHPEPSFILHWRCDPSSYKRNAVLMTMRKAKVSLACQRHRHNSRQSIWQISRKPTDPCLTGDRKARRFQQLARELPR